MTKNILIFNAFFFPPPKRIRNVEASLLSNLFGVLNARFKTAVITDNEITRIYASTPQGIYFIIVIK